MRPEARYVALSIETSDSNAAVVSAAIGDSEIDVVTMKNDLRRSCSEVFVMSFRGESILAVRCGVQALATACTNPVLCRMARSRSVVPSPRMLFSGMLASSYSGQHNTPLMIARVLVAAFTIASSLASSQASRVWICKPAPICIRPRMWYASIFSCLTAPSWEVLPMMMMSVIETRLMIVSMCLASAGSGLPAIMISSKRGVASPRE
jgi:hypothetical protein